MALFIVVEMGFGCVMCAHKVGQRAHQYVHELSTPGEKKESVCLDGGDN